MYDEGAIHVVDKDEEPMRITPSNVNLTMRMNEYTTR